MHGEYVVFQSAARFRFIEIFRAFANRWELDGVVQTFEDRAKVFRQRRELVCVQQQPREVREAAERAGNRPHQPISTEGEVV